jgi:hypothetical protein
MARTGGGEGSGIEKVNRTLYLMIFYVDTIHYFLSRLQPRRATWHLHWTATSVTMFYHCWRPMPITSVMQTTTLTYLTLHSKQHIDSPNASHSPRDRESVLLTLWLPWQGKILSPFRYGRTNRTLCFVRVADLVGKYGAAPTLKSFFFFY